MTSRPKGGEGLVSRPSAYAFPGWPDNFRTASAGAVTAVIAERRAMTRDTERALVAGAVGTAALTLMLALAPQLGSPALNFPLWDGTFFTLNLTWAVVLGYAVHFAIGMSLAVLFQRTVLPRYGSEAWLKGAAFGFLVWLTLMVAGFPLFDVLDPLAANGLLPSPGFFALGLGPTAPVMLLAAHLIYGAVVGALTGSVSHRALAKL